MSDHSRPYIDNILPTMVARAKSGIDVTAEAKFHFGSIDDKEVIYQILQKVMKLREEKDGPNEWFVLDLKKSKIRPETISTRSKLVLLISYLKNRLIDLKWDVYGPVVRTVVLDEIFTQGIPDQLNANQLKRNELFSIILNRRVRGIRETYKKGSEQKDGAYRSINKELTPQDKHQIDSILLTYGFEPIF